MTQLFYVPRAEFDRVRALPRSEVEVAALFAALCRLNTLYMITRANSGHVGSSLSSLDIVSWLYLNELQLDGAAPDIYFSSKGHDVPGLYAVLIGLGMLPFEQLHTLRRLGGLPGHPDVATPHIATNTGPLGMGISKAKGMVLANRLQGQARRLYVLTGDGELQEGQLWESLGSAANLGLSEITMVVDHNKVQSDTLVERVSRLGDLESKFQAFGWHTQRCDGHDLEAFCEALANARSRLHQPSVILADTIKGRGVSFMEHTAMPPGDRLYKYHSGAPSDDAYTQAAEELSAHANALLRAAGAAELLLESEPRMPVSVPLNAQRLLPAYARALVDQGERNSRLVVLDADLALDCGLLPFEERFPERFIECGIAEQDMVSQAGGLALRGLLPVVHSFACFLSTRPNEQIYNNATERTKVIYVAPLAGLLPGGPGHSHQSVRDIAALSAIPGLVLLEPGHEKEVALALDYCVNDTTESCYLRLVSVPWPADYDLPEDYTLTLGRGLALTHGTHAVLFSYGPVMLAEACRAASLLREQHGLALKVVNLPWLNRVDNAWLAETVEGFRHVFTLDNHYVAGGQGEMLAARLAELGMAAPPTITRFGVEGLPACGRNDEVLRFHRLDAESLTHKISRAIQGVQQDSDG